MKMTGIFALIVTVVLLPTVAADSHLQLPDTSKWKCKFCLVEEGWIGEVELGFGYVSDSSFKFGEYTGLNEEGGYFIANADLNYRNPDASYINLLVSDAGLDSRSLEIEGGVQGKYQLFMDYDEIPHFISDSASTPYQGTGSGSLTLPSTWVAAGTTAGMTDLAASLQNTDLGTQRKNLSTGLSYSLDSHWNYKINFRHDTKEGTKRTAGSFFFNSAQLIEPVDYITDEIEASVSYTENKWQANLAYNGSTFRNDTESLTWENAYTAIVAGADSGQLALPPDNQFHQISLSAGYEISDLSRVSGSIAIGHMEQTESLLAFTQNTALAVSPLPATSANAEVDTINANLRYTTLPTDALRLSATYNYNDRDNKTPQLIYDWVTTDAFLATPRTNLPYSFTQNLLKFRADYKLAKGTKLGAGYDLDTHERSFQEIDKTRENTLWGSLRLRRIENMFLEFKLEHIDRSASTYEAVAEIDPAQNVLLRKYNMADRIRNSLGIHASISPQPHYTVGLELDFSEDDYDKSDLGLTDSRDISLNGDVTTMLSENTSISFFAGLEKIESTQAGSQAFSTADWIASNDDSFSNFGIAVTRVVIKDRLDIGADYTRSHSTGKVSVINGGADPGFPELSTTLDSFRIYANYHFDDSLYLQVAYWHENYDSSDWALDGVSADTIPNVLSFGELSPSYSVDVFKLAMSYKF